ncbi:MAG: formylmethanofuran dehydrogenase subunit C [Methanocalculus sp. MSAO_Arc1]|uniref:formylmethanofuran dehydrogenase subunit C n=1 Tax=Methanocalculus TaxID=71151 RepID=UPI000FF477ED|nr:MULTISPECIES: formylmethanofuran dehydrogenase subunit C [unclassified Methanocalculus]MCP1663027.1 formylmethanofuran dehydrogenase subunit C [Methanocalculus sp. AMF5]RQD79809.1 MAG: formylmethanofuran dehydrogenase subunit C [Methanocalculus sp. MSAO_Arc1]
MDTVTLTIKEQPPLYLEAEVFNPDALAGKTAQEIADLPLPMGNTVCKVGDYFTVAGKGGATAAETKVVVNGDLAKVKYIGARMSSGEVVINSSTDMYVGAWMTGGKILVKGSVGDFAATAMKGGELVIEGNAGNYLAAAYRGDWRGMQGGRIHVKGNVAADTGFYMMGGEIVIDGDVGEHVMIHADGGKTVIKGNAKSRLGGQMVRGEIYLFGSLELMMPGFQHVGDVELEVEGVKATFAEYIGDVGERHPKSKGQIIYGKLYQKK